jgi:hypothetical protein
MVPVEEDIETPVVASVESPEGETLPTDPVADTPVAETLTFAVTLTLTELAVKVAELAGAVSFASPVSVVVPVEEVIEVPVAAIDIEAEGDALPAANVDEVDGAVSFESPVSVVVPVEDVMLTPGGLIVAFCITVVVTVTVPIAKVAEVPVAEMLAVSLTVPEANVALVPVAETETLFVAGDVIVASSFQVNDCELFFEFVKPRMTMILSPAAKVDDDPERFPLDLTPVVESETEIVVSASIDA